MYGDEVVQVMMESQIYAHIMMMTLPIEISRALGLDRVSVDAMYKVVNDDDEGLIMVDPDESILLSSSDLNDPIHDEEKA